MSVQPLEIVDFHNHYVGPDLPLTTLVGLPSAQRAFWENVNRRLSNPDELLSSIDGKVTAARVVNTPLEFLQDADGRVPPGTVPRINDAMAELVSRHSDKLYGLAT